MHSKTWCNIPAQVAAEKQLEESKTKIENLLDWLSNINNDSERAGTEHKQLIEQNGTHFDEGDGRLETGEEDDENGNLSAVDVSERDGGPEDNLNQQYQKIKVCCLNIMMQSESLPTRAKDRNN